MKPESQNNFYTSFKCAFDGLRHVFNTQRNFRFHLFAAFLVVVAAVLLDVDSNL